MKTKEMMTSETSDVPGHGLEYFKTTLLGGLLLVLPLALLGTVFLKIVEALQKVTTPLVSLVNVTHLESTWARYGVAFMTLLAICFAAGLVAKSAMVRSAMSHVEEWITDHYPPYRRIKRIGEHARDAHPAANYLPAVIETGGAAQLGFLVEDLGDGHSSVFLPNAPDPRSGRVLIVKNSGVTLLDVPDRELREVIRNLGEGSGRLLGVARENAG